MSLIRDHLKREAQRAQERHDTGMDRADCGYDDGRDARSSDALNTDDADELEAA
jgi:hypothetical protein